MSATTSIEWTDRTWNPTTGCDKVSPGCAHCYAEGVAERFWATQYPAIPVLCEDEGGLSHTTRPRQFTDVMTHDDRLLEPLSWRKPSKVFVNSMSDLFHKDVPDAFIDRVFAVMALAPQHTFQVLTKRPERMRDYMASRAKSAQFWKDAARAVGHALEWEGISLVKFPLPNVWLGVSVENQRFADERIPLLLQTPAAVRFISAEPLLGPVDLEFYLDPVCECETRESLHAGDQHDESCPAGGGKLDWVIVGGESGKGARPFDLAWARAIIQQCQAAGVPVFVKQLGAKPESRVYCTNDGSECDPPHGREQYATNPLDLKNRKGGDMSEWPDDLRIREFPTVEARRRHPNTVRT